MKPFAKPPYSDPPNGILASAFLWGYASSVLAMLVLLGSQYVPSSESWQWFLLPGILSPFVAFVLLARTFTLPTIRARWVLLAAAVFCLGSCATESVELPLHRTGPENPLPIFGSFGRLPIFIAIPAALWWIVYAIRRRRYLTALRAHPLRCFACKYDLSGLPDEANCPECGRARWEHPARATRLVSNPRWRRALVGTALLLTLACVVGFFARWCIEGLPIRRKLAAIGSTEYYSLPAQSPGDNPRRLNGSGVIVRIPEKPERVLLVILPQSSGDPASLPAVRIWLAAYEPLGGNASNSSFPLQLTHPVICDLTSDQAQRLFAHGIPASLTRAMLDAGGSVDPQFMWISSMDLSKDSPQTVRIDAAQHFP